VIFFQRRRHQAHLRPRKKTSRAATNLMAVCFSFDLHDFHFFVDAGGPKKENTLLRWGSGAEGCGALSWEITVAFESPRFMAPSYGGGGPWTPGKLGPKLSYKH